MFAFCREMFASNKFSSFVLIALIIAPLLITDAISSGRNRRRPSLSQANDDVTEKSEIPDQIALAAGRMDGPQYRMPISYTTEQENDKNNNNNYPYGNLEMNLIRPESERPRQHETNPEGSTHYTTNNNESPELEDAETAEEYVAKAMHIYGTRLREPIRITAESLAPDTPSAVQSTVGGGGGGGGGSSSSSSSRGGAGSHRSSASVGNGVKSYDVFELVERHQQQQQQQQQMQEEQQAKAQAAAAAAEAEAQAQALAQAQAIAQAQAEAQVQAEIQAHMQQQQQQQQQMESQTERIQMASPQPAPVYEKDPVTRSYDIFDYSSYTPAAERHYQPKYQQSSSPAGYLRSENEEKIRVSASTEIPKAEIMKQIEKSVMKYMKELEAEGKIVAATNTANTEETKVYYKSQPSESKRAGGSTVKPKSQYNGGGNGAATSYSNIEYSGRESASTSPSTMVRHHMPKQSSKSAISQQQQHIQETETSYQAPQDMADAMAPNIEFVYKIKTRAPLQSAAVKTVSKPYSLQLKGSGGGGSSGTVEQFDHSAALKAMEDFDLSHAITNEDEAQLAQQSQSQRFNIIGKPSKLYFNSETYHDINSLPYKTEKVRQSQTSEYRNAVKSDLPHPDYKGYPGYFVQSDSLEFEKGGESLPSSDDGYPIMNPYKYVFKKEALGNNKYEEAPEHQLPQRNKHHSSQFYSGQKAISAAASTDFDSYNPKFNNNPEGYGYQHSAYKGHLSSSSPSAENNYNHKFQSRHPGNSGAGGKRGKRGGSNNAHPVNNKKSARNAASKDIEADIALRPPPKA